MDSTQAIREAIQFIQSAMDDEDDQAHMQEVITQLQRLPQASGSIYGTLWSIDDLRIYRPAWSDDTLTKWFANECQGSQLENQACDDGREVIKILLETDGMCEGCGGDSSDDVCATCEDDYEITRCSKCDHVMRRDHIDYDICQICS